MQKLFLSLAVIVAVGGGVAASTGAFFSDTETSTGNTFTAGALDLTIDNSSYGFDWNNPLIPIANTTGAWGPNAANSWALSDLTNQLFFSFADLKPGDYGEDTISLHVQNNAWACMNLKLTGTPENGVNGPETAVPDLTTGTNDGELQDYLSFIFWNDDGDNVLEPGEQVIKELKRQVLHVTARVTKISHRRMELTLMSPSTQNRLATTTNSSAVLSTARRSSL